MEFCPNDEKALRKKKIGDEYYWYCPKCGYKKKMEGSRLQKSRRLELAKKEKIRQYKTRVIDGSEENLELLPKTKVICPKCGNNEAFYDQYQTRSADEPATTFYICTKCHHKWREY